MSVTPLYPPTTRASIRERVPSVRPRDIPRPRPQVSPDDRPQVSQRPAASPRKAPTAPARRATAGRASAILGAFLTRASMLSLAFILTYGIGALLGGVSLESARRQEIAARVRTDEAIRETAEIRARVLNLTSRDRIAQWAAARGMIDTRATAPERSISKPEKGGKSNGLLALR